MRRSGGRRSSDLFDKAQPEWKRRWLPHAVASWTGRPDGTRRATAAGHVPSRKPHTAFMSVIRERDKLTTFAGVIQTVREGGKWRATAAGHVPSRKPHTATPKLFVSVIHFASVQVYLAQNTLPLPLGPPQGPRYRPTVGS